MSSIRKFKEAMDSRRALFPRASAKHHSVDWYLDGHLVSRPLVAIYAIGMFAEYLLHLSRHGGGISELEAMHFFSRTRAAMSNILTNYPVGKHFNAKQTEAARALATELTEDARRTYAKARRHKSECPACRKHALSKADEELLEAILVKESLSGLIPPTSALYRVAT